MFSRFFSYRSSSSHPQRQERRRCKKLAEIRERGYVGAFSMLAKFLSPWRQPPAKTTTVSTEAAALEETRTALAPRQVSPQVSAALLSKFRTDLTPAQAEIVDAFKQQCPASR
jgi:hypothetical protein